MKTITAAIGKCLAAHLQGFAWQGSKSRLVRATDSGWQAIVIDVHPTTVAGFVKFSSYAHIRIDAVEATYLPHHPFVDAKSADSHPTLVANCDSLLHDRSLIRGFRPDSSFLAEYALRYASGARERIVPWLEKYTNEEQVLSGLIDSDPMQWVTSDRLTRYPVLMAILARRGDVIKFHAIKNEFLLYCGEPHARCYLPLASAMANINIQPKT